jgi:4-hydroxybenzoate polyprenyltransferase
LLAIITVLGLIFYNIYSKRMGIFKDILAAALVTLLYPLAFAFTDAAQTPRLKSLFIFPIWFFLTTMGYEILKDIRDAKGDSGIRSFFTIDYKLLSAISRTLIIVAGLIAFLPFFLGYCKSIYLIAAIIAFVLAIFATMTKPETAIRYVYMEVLLITLGSMADLLAFGS